MRSKVDLANMNQATNRELKPKLRFPEFRDAGEWEEKRIEDLSIRGSGHTPNKSEPSYYNGGIKWVSLADSNKLDNRYIYETKIEISKEGLENSSAVLHPPGTVIISRDAGVGKSAILHSAMAVSQHFIVWRCDESKLSNWFLYYFLQVLKPQLEAIATGSTIKTIGLPYFKELCIFTPSILEQQKIADCLYFIDDRITAETQKLDTLKAHKKGLMQQLFPAEGETLPKLRFPEFRDAGEWEENKLGDLSQILRGGSPRPIENFLTTDVYGLNWLKIGDVDKNSKYVTNTQERVRPDALSKTREVNPGDLILSNSMSFGRPYILKIRSCIHDGWIAITKIDKQIDRDYLYYLITSPTSQAYFLNNAAGSGVKNLNAEIIKLLPILFPQKSEQQKIADCLSSLDELITAQSQVIDLLKLHKKGLMQQLFPSVEDLQE